MRALSDAGVREVVASPGSRSTPFLLAAHREPRLRVRMVIDERAAAFFALGLARAGGPPPLLLCTSGTAPAHYYPAVIEASEASVPLLVLSADRPKDLVLARAPQSTDQTRLYGVHARAFVDLGEPSPAATSLALLQEAAVDAVARALGPEPGPVHLNAPARKPLEPTEAATDEGRALFARAGALTPRPPAPVRTLDPDAASLAAVRRALEESERPALVAGPRAIELASADVALRLAREGSLALMAETASQLRLGDRDGVLVADGFEHWIERGELTPDLVIEIGGVPTSSAYARWLDRAGPRRRFVLGGARHRDPSGRAEAVLLGPEARMLESLIATTPRAAWRKVIDAHERAAWHAVDVAMAEAPFGEAHASRVALEALDDVAADGATLAIGNSNPIRSLDRYTRGATLRNGRRVGVLSQRGVNGIDGWIAGCAGAAAQTRTPLLALIGDVTFSHDLGALALARQATSPLVYLVLDNRGGRIFEELPIASTLDEDDFRLFSTPPTVDLAAAAAAFGVRYARASEPVALRAALDEALRTPRASVVVAEVPEHGARDLLRAVKARLA